MTLSPLNVFVAYDQADADLKKDLLAYLAIWERQHVITIWSHDQIAPGQESSDLQATAMSRVIAELVRIRKFAEAEAMARSIGNDFLKANVMGDLATMLAQAGKVKDAQRIARSLKKNPSIRQKAFSNISMAGLLGASGVEPIARAIPAGSEREEALCNVAITYARENSWDEAETIAEEISDEQKRDEAWGVIARERAKAEKWTQAIIAFDKIQKRNRRMEVLHVWGELLIQTANRESREQIVQHLSKSQEKASLLVSMADALAQEGHYLEQLRLTQQAWLQASTKDDCQYLFAMIQGLLPHNPEMCIDFYTSFEWADTFLNE